jgi:antitoxin VapB
MAISIKNPIAEKLVHELADETGESLTQTIIHSVEDRLEKVRGQRRAPDLVQSLLAISQHCRELPDQDTRTPDEILGYNETGSFD